jgi:hypothetical protein
MNGVPFLEAYSVPQKYQCDMKVNEKRIKQILQICLETFIE